MYNRRLLSSRWAQYAEIVAFMLSFGFVIAVLIG